MGKTRIQTISETIAEKKPTQKLGRRDELVEKLKKDLEISDKEGAEGAKVGVEPKARGKLESQTQPTKRSKKLQKPSQAKPRSKKYQEAIKELDRSKTYPLSEALDITKKLSYSKFNGTLEAHIKTSQTGIRGLISVPYALNKKLRILLFASPVHLGVNQITAGEGFNLAILGNDSTIEEIGKGKVNFDLLITTPEWMPKLAKVAKVLGPKGLMPNPKAGTVTSDPKKALENFQKGQIEYKTEPKAPIIHLGVGKLNQPREELLANLKALLSSIGKSRIKKVVLSPTMGPGIKVDLTSL